jgi:hypothetical protein
LLGIKSSDAPLAVGRMEGLLERFFERESDFEKKRFADATAFVKRINDFA